jgi:hypothetical protein
MDGKYPYEKAKTFKRRLADFFLSFSKEKFIGIPIQKTARYRYIHWVPRDMDY